MPTLDQQIDALYQLPRDQFTVARNALAKTLTGAAASRVKGLVKPAVIPWAINQLFWQARPLYERLMKSGAAVRTAQLDALKTARAKSPKPVDTAKRREAIDRALDAHRPALAEAVARVLEIATRDASRPDAYAVSAMLEALSLAPKLPESPGRFTEIAAPTGFEALRR